MASIGRECFFCHRETFWATKGQECDFGHQEPFLAFLGLEVPFLVTVDPFWPLRAVSTCSWSLRTIYGLQGLVVLFLVTEDHF